MAPTPTFTGEVRQGKVQWDRPLDFSRHVKGLEGERVDVTVRKHRSKRSDLANRYYWGVVIAAISEHTGYEPEEAHDALKLLFLTDHAADGPLPRVKSTAKLNTSEFSDYVERVKRWAATDLGIYVPDANEVAA